MIFGRPDYVLVVARICRPVVGKRNTTNAPQDDSLAAEAQRRADV
jgi:hypothetical protein